MKICKDLPEVLAPLADRLVELPHPKGHCGVYLLIKDGEIVYVGESTSVYSRAYSHANSTGFKDFDRVVYLPTPAERLLEVEGALIRLLSPSYNNSGGYGIPRFDHIVLGELGIGVGDLL